MADILTISDLCVSYERNGFSCPALDGISLTLGRGEIFGIIGASGAGKTTLGNAAMGIFPSRVSGHVRYDGHDMRRIAPGTLARIRGGRLALLPQGTDALNPLVRAGSHIIETLTAHTGLSNAAAKTAAIDLLGTFRLQKPAEVFKAFPHQLSGGMAKQVLMAIAFACGPNLVIADEPTRGLDKQTKENILEILKTEARDRGAAVFLSTHDLDVAGICDRIAVMNQGRIVETGNPKRIFALPRHRYTQKLLASRPSQWAPSQGAVRPDTQPPAFLEVKNLSKGYSSGIFRRKKAPVLRDISLSIRPGERLGIMGGSGAGKTTLANILLRMIRADTGSVRMEDRDIFSFSGKALETFRQTVQAIPQHPETALNPGMTIRQSILEILDRHRITQTPAQVMDSVGLARDLLERRPRQLSGGELQRIMIARAVAMRPRLIIADEPTASLDMISQQEIFDLLLSQTRDLDASLVLISHDPDLIRAVCSRAFVLTRQGLEPLFKPHYSLSS